MTGNKIPIFEDDLNLLSTHEYNLRKDGYLIVTSADGTEAVKIARREKPDFTIFD